MGQIIPAGAPYRASVPTKGKASSTSSDPRRWPRSRAKLLMLEDAAHMTIFSHPTRIAEAVDELWGGALRYEEEL